MCVFSDGSSKADGAYELTYTNMSIASVWSVDEIKISYIL